MSVRKRIWTNPKGERNEAWVVDYVDQHGKRHIKTFSKKKAADAHHATVVVEVREGRHTPDSESITVAEAGRYWIKIGEDNNLERATLNEYGRHLNMHIIPYLGNVKLSKLTAPMVSEFRTKLREGAPPPGQTTTGRTRSPDLVNADGGLELPPKVVQERLGHSTIAMTMDTYGHLFPRGDDAAELAAAERLLLG